MKYVLLIFKFYQFRDEKLNELIEECDSLKAIIEKNEHVFGDRRSLEEVNSKVEAFENLCSKLKNLLLTEESKRGNKKLKYLKQSIYIKFLYFYFVNLFYLRKILFC